VLQGDAGDPASVKRTFEEVTARLGGLDILVNDAGVARAARECPR
jgi:NAD(P)-dependent dehydrogenase (short-subunit alcohol dehydrogenase family)